MSSLYSATQINLFGECPRKWAWRYVAGIHPPTHPSAALGTEVEDEQLQPFLRDGRDFDFSRESGYIAASAVGLLPAKGSIPDEQLQRHFVLPSHTTPGVGLQGYLDLWPEPSAIPIAAFDPLQIPNGREIDGKLPPVVVDFKTTSNLGKWAKTAKDLAVDTQAQLYATWAMRETRARVVDLVWIYMQTKGARRAEARHLRVYGQGVVEQYTRIHDRTLEVHAVRATCTDPLSLPPNTDACAEFGGCPYQSNCNLSVGEIADARAAKAKREREARQMNENTTTPNTTMGLLARMRAQRAGEAPAAPSAAPAAPAFAGINPPESKLEPAPPVGVASSAPAPAAAPAPAEPAKRGPGRPRKLQPGAEATPAPGPSIVKTTAEPPPAPVAPAPAPEDPDAAELQTISVVWGKERFQPLSYNDVEIGPFEATASLRPGETIAQAHARVYAELEKAAEIARGAKLASYAKALVDTGIAK